MAELMAARQRRAACERCARLRKKCVLPAGADKCNRCAYNGEVCVARIRGKPGPQASPKAGGASKKSATTTFEKSSQATGFAPSLFEMLAKLPPGHAGLRSATRFFIMTASAHGEVPPPLAALGARAGLDMASVSAGPPSMDLTTLQWSDVPSEFRTHHDRARAYSQGQRFLHAVRVIRNTICVYSAEPLRAIFGADMITPEVAGVHFEEAHAPKLLKGLPHVIEACAKFGQVHTVVIDNVRLKTGIHVSVYLTNYVVAAEESCFACEMVPAEAAPVAATFVEPSSAPLQWSLPEEDIRILQNIFE